jgi:hypothetical protein
VGNGQVLFFRYGIAYDRLQHCGAERGVATAEGRVVPPLWTPGADSLVHIWCKGYAGEAIGKAVRLRDGIAEAVFRLGLLRGQARIRKLPNKISAGDGTRTRTPR